MATHQIAQGIAQLGRNGDSTLVHMQPEEVAGLQALAKSQGTSLTINPETGLPEAFSLGGMFRSLLPTIAGFAAAGLSGGTINPLTMGMIAGAGTGALLNKKDPLMGAAMGGLGGYGGAGLYNVGAAMPGQAANFETAMGLDKAYTAGQGAQAATSGFENSMGLTGAYNAGNPAMANIANATGTTTSEMMLNPGAQQAFQNQATNAFQQGIGRVTGSAGNLADVATFKPGAFDAFSAAGGTPLKAGMPLAGGILGGLEPSDLGYNPMKPNDREKYDPYATLNLNTNTGLKLYAQGGPISFADGGDALKGGGNDALRGGGNDALRGGGNDAIQGGNSGSMQGANLIPLDVADINAKYGYNGDSSAKYSGFYNPGGAWGSPDMYGAKSSMPIVQVPMLGMFADNDQIEAARTAYEQQLAAAMSGRGGMGSTPNAAQVGRSMGTMSGGPMATQSSGLAGLGSMGSTAATAPTASTAETSLSRLNLNKNYAQGGAIQGGGLQDLYGSSDNVTPPQLSQDGYGLGRLQAMAQGGAMGYAEGGETRYTLDKNSLGGKMFGETGVIDQLPPSALAEILGNPGMRHFMGFRGVEEPKYYTASGMGGGSGALSTVGPRVNLNTASGVGMAKGGYLDGPGDGMSDSIPATIEGKQPARLADGEFVVPADVVSHLGNGSTKAGSQRLYGMLDKVRKARTGTKKQGKQINPNKYMPA